MTIIDLISHLFFQHRRLAMQSFVGLTSEITEIVVDIKINKKKTVWQKYEI